MWSGLFWGLPTNYSFPQNCLWLTLTLHFVLSSYSCCDLFWSCGNGFWVTPPRKFRHPGVFCDGHLREKNRPHFRSFTLWIRRNRMSGFCMCLSIVPPPAPPSNGLRPSCRKEWFSERTLQQIFFVHNKMFGHCFYNDQLLFSENSSICDSRLFSIFKNWTVMWSDGMAKM